MTPTSSHGHDDHLYADGLHNEDVAHEHSDVNVRALIFFAVGLAAVTALAALVVLGVFKVFERQAAANDPQLSPLARPAGALPPEPRLLTDEPQNLQRFLATEGEALKRIEDAKKQILQQGLPVRADAPADAWIGQHSQARGGSSSGRAIPLAPGGAGAAQPPSPPPSQTTPPKSGGH
jgi:hypothetical protein